MLKKGVTVTLDDVAQRARVSRTTASRAMNGVSTVDPARAAAVLKAAQDLGFTPNPAARALAAGRRNAIALVVPDLDVGMDFNPFFSTALQGIVSAVASTDQQLVLLLRAEGESDEKFLRYLRSSHVDGALVILEAHSLMLPALMDDAGVPVVYLGRPAESSTMRISFVDSDNEGGARSAVHALVDAGRRRIAVIAGPSGMGVTVDRLRGWSLALRDAGLSDDLIEYADFSRGGGAAAMDRLLARDARIDGVFAMSDTMAAGALASLRQGHKAVPDDIAIASFDDTVIATTVEPALTTVRQPLRELGALMVNTLQAVIADPTGEPIRTLLPTTLIRRDSL